MSFAHVCALGYIIERILLIALELRHDVRHVVAVHGIEIGGADHGDLATRRIKSSLIFKICQLRRGNGSIGAVHALIVVRLRGPADKRRGWRQAAAIRWGSRRQTDAIAVPVRRLIMHFAIFAIERLTLYVIEQHLCLV